MILDSLLGHLRPRKIALLRASRLGDFLCATPAMRALRAAAPQAEIVLVTLPRLRDIAVRLPFIDRFVAFPGFPGIAQQFFDPRLALEFFQRMQSERFDLAIQLQGSGVYANPFMLLLGATATAGFVRAEDDPSCLDRALVWPAHGHEVQRLLALMQAIGAKPGREELLFPVNAEERAVAAALLARLPRPIIAIHAGSHDARRRWPLERFADTARALLSRYGGTVVLVGGIEETERALELAAAIGAATYNIVGRTSLAELGGVIAGSAILISNDSGPAHVGYALGTPTIGIYRAGGTERYGPPVPGPFIALEPRDHGDPDALVEVEQVLDAAERMLEMSSNDDGARAGCISETA